MWKANRNAANDTMIDSDNVLLLKPAWEGAEFRGSGRGMVFATIHYFDAPVDDATIAAFRDRAADLIAACVTEPAENNFPALPVRTGEHVFVTFAFSPHPPELAGPIKKSETLRLIPTARSRLGN